MSFGERRRSNGAVYGDALDAWATMHVAQQVPMSGDKDLAEHKPQDQQEPRTQASSTEAFLVEPLVLKGWSGIQLRAEHKPKDKQDRRAHASSAEAFLAQPLVLEGCSLIRLRSRKSFGTQPPRPHSWLRFGLLSTFLVSKPRDPRTAASSAEASLSLPSVLAGWSGIRVFGRKLSRSSRPRSHSWLRFGLLCDSLLSRRSTAYFEYKSNCLIGPVSGREKRNFRVG